LRLVLGRNKWISILHLQQAHRSCVQTCIETKMQAYMDTNKGLHEYRFDPTYSRDEQLAATETVGRVNVPGATTL
jgi:hypothetical protein